MATATAEPRTIEFDMTPQTWPEPERKFIPPSLRGRRNFEFGGRSPQEEATTYGLFWLKFLRNCVGLKPGEFFSIGDKAQVPGNHAIAFVEQNQAEFVRDEKIEDECRFLDEAKKKGYKVDGPPKRLADRPEYQALLDAKKNRKKNWMADTLTPANS